MAKRAPEGEDDELQVAGLLHTLGPYDSIAMRPCQFFSPHLYVLGLKLMWP